MKVDVKKMNDLRYIRYSRKSSESKEKQALSIQDQNSECDEYASRLNIAFSYKLQESRSSFKPHNRPEFDKMIELIKSGQANAIISWKPDRLCRNPEEGGKLLQMLQDGVLKEIRTATGDLYTQESDHLVLQIHFGMANQYSRNLSQNVRRGLVHKCERGEYPRPAPIGYESYGERGQRKMKPHPVQAPLISKAFQLASTGGKSLSQISNELNSLGLRTKMDKKIGKSHLHNILKCSTYFGYFLHNGELFEGEYEPIISKQLYDDVQEALGRRSKPKVKVWEHTYNGLITCADCGCQITTTVKTKVYKRTNRTATYTYHQCTHRRGNCSQKAITGKRLEKILSDNFEQISLKEEDWKLGIDLFKARHAEESKKLDKRFRYLQNNFNSIQSEISGIIKMRANQELTQEEFLGQKAGLLKQRKDIEEKLGDNTNSADIWLELCTRYLNNAFSAREIIEHGTRDEKRDLILELGQNLILEDKKLQFSFKQPYDVLLLPEYRTNMMRDMDSDHDR